MTSILVQLNMPCTIRDFYVCVKPDLLRFFFNLICKGNRV